MITETRGTPPGFLKLPVQLKSKLLVFTFLTRCHNLNWWSLDAMISFWRTPPCFSFLWGWVDVCPWIPYLGTLCFCVMLERLFAWVASPSMCGQAGVNFISNSDRQTMSEKIIPMAILVTDRVGEGIVGLTTVFCWSNQKKVELSNVLSFLVQWDSPDLGIVVVKIFTNMAFLQGGLLASPTLT